MLLLELFEKVNPQTIRWGTPLITPKGGCVDVPPSETHAEMLYNINGLTWLQAIGQEPDSSNEQLWVDYALERGWIRALWSVSASSSHFYLNIINPSKKALETIKNWLQDTHYTFNTFTLNDDASHTNETKFIRAMQNR